jgi:hypothetical protein
MCKNVDIKKVRYDLDLIKNVLEDIGLTVDVIKQIIDNLETKK